MKTFREIVSSLSFGEIEIYRHGLPLVMKAKIAKLDSETYMIIDVRRPEKKD